MMADTFPSTSKDTREPLIKGLTDDIALVCLARLPRGYHSVLKCVSKRWKLLLESEEFHRICEALVQKETRVYAICRHHSAGRTFYYVLDPSSRRKCWRAIECVPPECVKRDGMSFETVGSKLYVMGGCGWTEDATDDVFYYNAPMNTWGKAASMPTPRCYFLSATIGNKIYITDATKIKSMELQTWDVYDTLLNTWSESHNRNSASEMHQPVSLDDEIYTIHEPPHNLGGAESPNFAAFCNSPIVIVDGNLYLLDQSCGLKLMTWHKDSLDWVMVGRLSTKMIKPPCQITAYGRTIVVVGRGLTTAAFDVDKAGRVRGMMVSSFSLPEKDPFLCVLS